MLAVVNSTGMLSFLKLATSPKTNHPYLTEIVCHQPLGSQQDVLILSCCWHPSMSDILAITTSTNEVHVLQVDEMWNIKPGESLIHSHEDQAWTSAFAPDILGPEMPRKFTILSGGDDFRLLSSTCEFSNEDSWIEPDDTKQIGRHNYGVTAILPLHINQESQEFILLTGSYDDHIRVYVAGHIPRLLAKMDLGGGVWRLKAIRHDADSEGAGNWTATVVASCMYAGARIVRLSGSWYDCNIEVLARFEEHESMNYGSDFQRRGDGKPARIITTSFYDKRLCQWDFS